MAQTKTIQEHTKKEIVAFIEKMYGNMGKTVPANVGRMVKKDLVKFYQDTHAEYRAFKAEQQSAGSETAPAETTTKEDNNMSKKETIAKEMVSKEYMVKQVELAVKATEDRMMAKFEQMLAKQNAPVVEVKDAEVQEVKAKELSDEEKLDAVKTKEAELHEKFNNVVVEISKHPWGSPERKKLEKEMKQIMDDRKVTLEYIRIHTADGLRKFADVQESGINRAIDWTADGLVKIINMTRNGSKSVNSGIANGVRWTADQVDPRVEKQAKATETAQPATN